MAQIKSVQKYEDKPKIKRKGVHAKKQYSKSKTSKLYKKLSRGQG